MSIRCGDGLRECRGGWKLRKLCIQRQVKLPESYNPLQIVLKGLRQVLRLHKLFVCRALLALEQVGHASHLEDASNRRG
jgi:hypothetical protein